MCGRFAQTESGEVIAATFQLPAVPELYPRYNIAPTQAVAVVTQSPKTQDRVCHEKRWGLVPKWAKDINIGNRLINARAETIAEKPSFRDAFQRRRCLVVADGFYEWQRSPDSKTKQPYLIQLQTRSPFAFAGLWERWLDPQSQEPLFSCTIITTTANEVMTPIHDRMPVILPTDAYDAWLDTASFNRSTLEQFLRPYDADAIMTTPVSTAVNNPRHDSEAVQQPVEPSENS